MEQKNQNICAVILAGGKSSRFGNDKAFIKIGNTYLIEILISKLRTRFDNVIISANQPELFAQFELPIVKDIFPNFGPLGGIHSSLVHSNAEYSFVVACDMPFINKDLLDLLINFEPKNDAIIPYGNGRLQPLFAIYKNSIVSKIEEVFKGKYPKEYLAVHNFIKLINTNIVDVTSKGFYNEFTFYNINTPDDLNKIVEHLKKIYSATDTIKNSKSTK